MTKQDRQCGIWKWWTSHWNIIWTYYCWLLLLKINYYCIAWNNREFWWLPPPLPLILNASPLASFLKKFASHSWPERGTVTLKEHKPWVGLRFTTVYAQSSILTHLALGPQHFCKGHLLRPKNRIILQHHIPGDDFSFDKQMLHPQKSNWNLCQHLL